MNFPSPRLLPLLALLAGCSSGGGILPDFGEIRLWPFGERAPAEVSRTPSGSTEYRCEGNRGFYLRPLDGGALWLIAPDREIRLPKLAGAEGRYGVGRIVLELNGDAATLTDPPASFAACRRVGAKT